ncbi:hypothetical protein OVA14_08145 [Agrococcus sp. SL85]|uniref:hypothetical protein n=1 Tax=Agrococcus sp. SL85 TaxID=2995141 RepID=UPI00226C9794|nr:hypothetical protein [Agrococcus sp. SL85]WAC65348.1 hypothetical protein OVA14_08145 [Agrococcus sp. SL85]
MALPVDPWSFLPLIGVLAGFAVAVVIAVQLLRLALARRARAAVVPVEPVVPAALDDTVPLS